MKPVLTKLVSEKLKKNVFFYASPNGLKFSERTKQVDPIYVYFNYLIDNPTALCELSISASQQKAFSASQLASPHLETLPRMEMFSQLRIFKSFSPFELVTQDLSALGAVGQFWPALPESDTWILLLLNTLTSTLKPAQ